MFCFQCEQAAKGTGCEIQGVCGKMPSSSNLQDLILSELEALSFVVRGKHISPAVRRLILDGLFTTVTNVNFDDAALVKMLKDINAAKLALIGSDAAQNADALSFKAADTDAEIVAQARAHFVKSVRAREDADIFSLKSLLRFGLKGMAAYACHARILGVEDDGVYDFFVEALAALHGGADADALLGLSLKCGEVNLKVMEMLDKANTAAYGHPEPTRVRTTPVKGKALLVSGHDLKDLAEILEQTEGTGVNVYTHGEMLPCLAYPGLKKYKHLVGNYGGAWQDQQKEFAQFPGSIVMTTNCIQNPKEYADRIFTAGLVGWPGVAHIADGNFAPAIAKALAMDGFAADAPAEYITVGFGHQAVLGVADKVVAAVKAGKIRRFFLIGGCDGAKSGRNYYTEFAEKLPHDCVILTLACGKYRFNKLAFGEIDGLPRLLDMGQCNDAYSAIRVAVALAQAFGCSVNELPLSFILSWYEQKAVCILLTLLHLGIKNIRLGPTLPAFISPNVLRVLVDKFNIAPITTAEADLKAILG